MSTYVFYSVYVNEIPDNSICGAHEYVHSLRTRLQLGHWWLWDYNWDIDDFLSQTTNLYIYKKKKNQYKHLNTSLKLSFTQCTSGWIVGLFFNH